MKTYADFCRHVSALLDGTAEEKGYNDTGIDGPNQLYDFVRTSTGDHGHAAGEIIYKIVRFLKRRDDVDLLKISAWAFLIWKTTGSPSSSREFLQSIDVGDMDERRTADKVGRATPPQPR